MAKAKNKGTKSSGNKHLQARVDFLSRVSFYLAAHGKNALQEDPIQDPAISDVKRLSQKDADSALVQSSLAAMEYTMNRKPEQASEQSLKGELMSNQSLRLANHLRAVALKSQIRLDLDTKRSICKVCDTPLIEGMSSMKYLENLSKGKKKPWANMFVVKCLTCGCPKRFPTGSKRQHKKKERQMQDVKPTEKGLALRRPEPVSLCD
ncbi:hypothetical protein K431DRAFT_247530 [Polychaeton citri CBS 116435]|uniref:Rpr2-domain-containing protein n=1 Tax=Polychaeton citri CBS 116435 TaxID=1314669 RepID=A0A9P4QA91_9PEZI|nr:hypothetical protein K431DRAFT_247530 [Polychaeton citri CBS 116435]